MDADTVTSGGSNGGTLTLMSIICMHEPDAVLASAGFDSRTRCAVPEDGLNAIDAEMNAGPCFPWQCTFAREFADCIDDWAAA